MKIPAVAGISFSSDEIRPDIGIWGRVLVVGGFEFEITPATLNPDHKHRDRGNGSHEAYPSEQHAVLSARVSAGDAEYCKKCRDGDEVETAVVLGEADDFGEEDHDGVKPVFELLGQPGLLIWGTEGSSFR